MAGFLIGRRRIAGTKSLRRAVGEGDRIFPGKEINDGGSVFVTVYSDVATRLDGE